MRKSRPVVALAATVAVLVSLAAAPAQADRPRFQHLNPGGQPSLAERVPVNVVFIGYEPAQVPAAAFQAGLPRRYEPVVRSRLGYEVKEKLGLTYTYDYRIRYADRAYEDRFFGQLARLARPAPLTEYQTSYNNQKKNVLEVTANHHIDAPSVERWLAYHPPSAVDTRRNTVFFINWYGRADFRFHVYTKTDEPDPDTGYNFGEQRDSRKLIAWGGTTADDPQTGLGTTRRVWFHDLSAGPESWTKNWNVDTRDLDDDDVEDYRMPPIWEYTARGYRAPGALAKDLSLITRYVAINLLFTSSPVYPVQLPTTEPPTSINLDSNTYEGWPGVDASATYIKPRMLLSKLRKLRWTNRLDFDSQDLPYTGDAKRCYEMFLNGKACLPKLEDSAFANLFQQNRRDLARTQDDQGTVDYELPIFSYAVAGVDSPVLGFADSNHVDGTQSYVFAFLNPQTVKAGYGLTTTLIHEVGHHLGMSHPRDGYDSDTGVDYAPANEFYFVQSGDQTNSMMSYIDLNWDFSQFDRDNSDRFLAAAHNAAANRMAAAALAAPHPQRAITELRAADRLLSKAKHALAAHDYPAAHALSQLAYQATVSGARQAGAPVNTVAADMAAKARAARRANTIHQDGEFIDTLDPDSPRSQP